MLATQKHSYNAGWIFWRFDWHFGELKNIFEYIKMALVPIMATRQENNIGTTKATVYTPMLIIHKV